MLVDLSETQAVSIVETAKKLRKASDLADQFHGANLLDVLIVQARIERDMRELMYNIADRICDIIEATTIDLAINDLSGDISDVSYVQKVKRSFKTCCQRRLHPRMRYDVY